MNPILIVDQETEHIPLGLVATFEPDNFGRLALYQADLVEIRILGNNRIAVFFGKAPDSDVVGMLKS